MVNWGVEPEITVHGCPDKMSDQIQNVQAFWKYAINTMYNCTHYYNVLNVIGCFFEHYGCADPLTFLHPKSSVYQLVPV